MKKGNSDFINKHKKGCINAASVLMFIIIAGIGKIYGEKPVGSRTAIEQAIIVIIDDSAKYLGSKKSFSKNFK